MARSLQRLGDLAAGGGDVDLARGHYAESLELWRELGDRWGIARALDGFATLAAAQSQHERALRLGGAAAALRTSLGAPLPTREQGPLERRLAPARLALGEQAAATTWEEGQQLPLEQVIASALAPGVAALLTPREQEILLLVAQGLTNREISEALVINRRTAETHAYHILSKLGLTSRAQVAGWAAEHGLLRSRNGRPGRRAYAHSAGRASLRVSTDAVEAGTA
jgi:DNA-binding CsgD family transcriptional regulator